MCRHTLATCCLLTFCLILSSSAGATWSGTVADQQISYDDDEAARAVQIIYNTWVETLHILWSEDAPSVRELHYGRSTDRGITWTSTTGDRIISFQDGNDVWPEECAVALDPNYGSQTMIVVWSEDVVDTREVHYGISTDDGVTWSCETEDLVLSDLSSTVNPQTPSVAIDHAGTMHVVWHQEAPQGRPAEVHYSRSTDGGATWSGSTADRIISYQDYNPTLEPMITVGADDRLYVVWREIGESGNQAIHLGMSEDGGDTWSSEVADREISQPANKWTNHAVAATEYAEDGVHVVYTVSYDTQSPYYYEVYSTSSYDNGATWDGEAGLVPVSHDEGAGRSASNPDVFVGPAQGAIAVWNEEYDATGTAEQHISYLRGDWTGADGDEIISFPDNENGYRPSITGSLDQIVVPPRDDPFDTFVAWTEFNGTSPDYYEVHLSAARLIVNAAGEPVVSSGPSLRVAPNPSDGATRIEWVATAHTPIDITILDAAGRRIRSFRRSTGAGFQSLIWDRTDRHGRRLPAGFYFARLRTESGTWTFPLVLL
jgi:hypothetical protein